MIIYVNINYSIESELDGDLFTITNHGNFGSGFSGSYLYLKDGISADYETKSELSLTIKATDSDGFFDLETMSIDVRDDISDNSGYEKGDQNTLLDPLLNNDLNAWKGIGQYTHYSQMDLDFNYHWHLLMIIIVMAFIQSYISKVIGIRT